MNQRTLTDALGFELEPYQRAFLERRSERKAMQGARQVGKTTTALCEAVLRAADGPVVYVAPTHQMMTRAEGHFHAAFPEEIVEVVEDDIRFASLWSFQHHGYEAETIIADDLDDEWHKLAALPDGAKTFRRASKYRLFSTPTPEVSILPFMQLAPEWDVFQVSMPDSEFIGEEELNRLKAEMPSPEALMSEVYGCFD